MPSAIWFSSGRGVFPMSVAHVQTRRGLRKRKGARCSGQMPVSGTRVAPCATPCWLARNNDSLLLSVKKTNAPLTDLHFQQFWQVIAMPNIFPLVSIFIGWPETIWNHIWCVPQATVIFYNKTTDTIIMKYSKTIFPVIKDGMTDSGETNF